MNKPKLTKEAIEAAEEDMKIEDMKIHKEHVQETVQKYKERFPPAILQLFLNSEPQNK